MSMETRTIALLVIEAGKETFHESATEVRITDDAAGEFVTVKQDGADSSGIRINPEEWPTLRAAIDKMISECREQQ